MDIFWSKKASAEIVPWEKGDRTNSQSEIYSRLPEGHVVLFYQGGNEEKGIFDIEIAIAPIPLEYYLNYYEKIMKKVEKNAGKRKVCKFNR